MRSWIFAVVVALSAAFPAFADPKVAPPTPESVSVRVSAEQNGETIQAAPGATFAVELVGSPSTGTSWIVTSKPDFLATPRFLTGPTTLAQQQPGFVGGQRWQVYTFEVKEAGEGDLVLEQHSAQNRGGPALATFQIKINAQ